MTKTPKELAKFYGVTTRTLQTWFKPYAILFKKNKRKRYYTMEEIVFIQSKFGGIGENKGSSLGISKIK